MRPLLSALAASLTAFALLIPVSVAKTMTNGGSWQQGLSEFWGRIRRNPTLIGTWLLFPVVIVRVGGLETSYFEYLAIIVGGLVVGFGIVVLISWFISGAVDRAKRYPPNDD